MKTGSGTDPFDGESDEDEEEDADIVEESAADELADDGLDEIPYLLRRSSVKAGRTDVAFPLQDETQAEASEVLGAIERDLEADVWESDFREAAFLVGLRHEDEIVDVLKRWGYEYRE